MPIEDVFIAQTRDTIRRLIPTVVSAWKATTKTSLSKRDGSLVTETDRLVERELTRDLELVLPQGIPIVGEEQVCEESGQLSAESSAVYRRVFALDHCVVIDPIDGTKNFVEGSRYFCIAVGLLTATHEGHWPVAGVVAIPAEDSMYWSGGSQVFKECISTGTCERVSRSSSRGAAIFANSTEQRWLEMNNQKLVGDRISRGASVYDILMTCLGENRAALLGSQRLWDIAAPLALARPLGLVLRDAQTGEPISGLTSDDFSPDLLKKLWRLDRRMLLLPEGVKTSDIITEA